MNKNDHRTFIYVELKPREIFCSFFLIFFFRGYLTFSLYRAMCACNYDTLAEFGEQTFDGTPTDTDGYFVEMAMRLAVLARRI